MKMISILSLMLIIQPVLGQDVWEKLKKNRAAISDKAKADETKTSKVQTKETKTNVVNTTCNSAQTSLPWAYIEDYLFQEEPLKLDVAHDPRTGKLKLTTGGMVSNCDSMLNWTINKETNADGKVIYALELKFKRGDNCKVVDGKEKCSYSLNKVVDKELKDLPAVDLEPNLDGLKQCLSSTADGWNTRKTLIGEFEDIKDTGEILVVNKGKELSIVPPKYSTSFEIHNGCSRYEKPTKDGITLYSEKDEKKREILLKAAELDTCPVSEYSKLANFIEDFEGYAAEFAEISAKIEEKRTKLSEDVLEIAKRSAAAIAAGDYTEKDLKTIEDFQKYITDPLVQNAVDLYDEMLDLEGDAKIAKQEELKIVLGKISTYNKAPYYTEDAHLRKLEADGKYESAETLKGLKALLFSHLHLGDKVDGVVITPKVAMANTRDITTSYAEEIIELKEKNAYKTGQSSGKAKAYRLMVEALTKNIQERNVNYNNAIMAETQRMSPGGACYQGISFNVNGCIQKSQIRIKALQEDLANDNKVDAERAQKFADKAKEYAELEAEGKRYVASKNGEDTSSIVAEDTTVVPAGGANGTFDFNQTAIFQQQQSQQQAAILAQQQQMQYQQYQQPYMGSNNFQYGYQPTYGYNSFGNFGYPQTNSFQGYYPQMQVGGSFGGNGYWGSPYQSYSNPSFYGGFGSGYNNRFGL